ncbi:MAG TPA: DUF4142 domain-containing protein [Chthonomonadaceae bacterium]|nr:DUF4142 domain-containing protein [Chthonomonadaceae bacterium]
MRRLIMSALAAAGILSAFAAGAAPRQQGEMNWMDRRFVRMAAEGGQAEVQMANMALDKRTNGPVREFARRMVDDHTRANDRLAALASDQNIALPNGIGFTNRQTMDRLMNLSGFAFDRAYASNQVQAHVQTVALFRQEARDGRNPALRDFARNTLPTLNEHLRMARNLGRMESRPAFYRRWRGSSGY